MVIATSYPFLNVLWDILIIFAWVLFIWIAIVAFTDLFRRRDIRAGAKLRGWSSSCSFRGSACWPT